MKSLFKQLSFTALALLIMSSSALAAYAVLPKYALGKVSGFTDSSRAGYLDVTSIVPSPSNTIEHQFSANMVVAQDCPPGGDCYDVMRRTKSGWSTQGQRLYQRELYGHTGKGRDPKVEGYRNFGR